MDALIEPFFYCLFASVFWAPLVFLSAHRLSANDHGSIGASGSLGRKIWPVALVIAVLPVIMAPIAATLGLSLRAPAALPPMAEFAAFAGGTAGVTAPTAAPAAATVSLADILRMTAVLYFYGFLMLLALAIVRHIWFAYRLNYAIPIDEPALEAKLEYWRRRIGVMQKPRYLFSHIVSSVCVYGFFRPVIVMPDNLLERVSIEDAALMGAHEMAHVKRGDVALFALCSAVKAVFWFNPFMHRICARANLAAEQGADALVLARGVDRRKYAHCFVQGLRLAAGSPQNRFTGELAPSFTPFDKRSRRARLDAILSGASDTALLNLPAKLSLGACAVLAAGLAFAQAAFAVSPPPAVHALPVVPVEGEITLAFGKQSRLLGEDRPLHEGVDIRAPRGAPVRAAGDGKVIDATERYQGSTAWGNVVVIDHGHGLVTRYAHLDSYAVRKGDRIKAGDVLGAVGATGKATGPHLHFEVIENGEHVDPGSALAIAPAPLAPINAAPKMKSARNVPIAPLPSKASIAPEANINFEIVGEAEPELNEKHARKLEKQLEKLEGKLREQFKDFDAFSDLDDIVIRFNDVEFEGFEGAEAFSGMLDGREFQFDDFSGFPFIQPEGWRFSFNSELSAEEREQIKRAHEEARRNAAKAMERAKKEMAREKREAERTRRQALATLNEKDRERALEQAKHERERAFERMQREVERALEQAEREREQALEQAEWERERVQAQAELARATALSEAEALELQERAILNAKAGLEKQLAAIEKRQRQLERTQRKNRR